MPRSVNDIIAGVRPQRETSSPVRILSALRASRMRAPIAAVSAPGGGLSWKHKDILLNILTLLNRYVKITT